MLRPTSKVSAGLAALVLGLGWALGLAAPSSLAGAAAWSLVVFGVLFGLGGLIARIAAVDAGPGETMVLGTVGWITLTGPLIAAGICSRVPMLAVAGLASAACVYCVATRPVATRRTIDRVALILCALLGVVLAIQLLGMVATRGNPFDDQVGYTALVKRLLDCGDLIEPFSFRRVSAYGGQTSLLALAALRGDVESTDLLDRGIFQCIAIVLVIDLARRRRVHLAVTAVVVVFLMTVWDISINSAGTWTGFALFLCSYSFASREEVPAGSALALTFATCAAACTIRQNYLMPAGLFAAVLLVRHVQVEARASSWRTAILTERKTILLTVGIAAAIVLPYMVAAWMSNRTFLYPIMLGTVNASVPLRPTAVTLGDELVFFVTTTLAQEPIRVWWVLAPLMVIARDSHRLRPFHILLATSAFGFVFLIHSFMLSDAGTLWRYAWGYLTPLVFVFLIEIAPRTSTDKAAMDSSTLRLDSIAKQLVWLAVLAQFVSNREAAAERLEVSIQNVRAAVKLGTNKSADSAIYRDLQESIPAGTRVAVMIDDPYLLDFSRNEIFNLDLPGFASPKPGLPAYLGPERWRTYFLSVGIRYVAYVDATHSAYLYRRYQWISRMLAEGEIWRFMGARMLDTSDTLAALTESSKVLFSRDGLVAIDLGTSAQPAPSTPDLPELRRRDEYVRKISEQELGNAAWKLASRSDVVFVPDGQGPSGLQMIDPIRGLRLATDTGWDALTGARSLIPPFRWLSDRTLVRVHGSGRQRYRIKAWADVGHLMTIPSVRVVLDGTELGRVRADEAGNVELSGEAECHGWCDLYLVMSSVSEYWVPAEDLKAVKLLELEWDSASR